MLLKLSVPSSKGEGSKELLRDQVDHHLPPCTALVWEEKRSPNSKKEKTRTKDMPSVALVPESWQAYRSLHHTDTC